MRKVVELHEEIDEVNYFLKEWLRLQQSPDSSSRIIRKAEIRFVAHAIERVIKEADSLDIPVLLQTGSNPVLATPAHGFRHDRKSNSSNWLIPSKTTVPLTYFRRFKTKKGDRLAYIGNERGLLSLKSLAETISTGGELRLAGYQPGEW